MDAIIFAMKALSMPMLAANAPVKFNLESTKKKNHHYSLYPDSL